MLDLLAGVSGLGLVILLFALFLLFILMPLSAYEAQKYACKCYRELQKMNLLLATLVNRPVEKPPDETGGPLKDLVEGKLK